MPYSTRFRTTGSAFSSGLTPAVKWLLLTNVGIFVLYYFATLTGWGSLFHPLGLVPADVLGRLALWQLVTYMFVHDPYGFWHILFNMLTLWMFGVTLERTWGTRRFLKYYFLCGTGAGVCVVLANLLFGSLYVRTIGASGAIYGLLLAFGVLFPEVEILFAFLFPIKAKYFVLILGGIAFMSTFQPEAGGVSHVAHLGGMLFGLLYLKRGLPSGVSLSSRLERWYKDWKLQRAKRKFQVYLKKQEKDSDRWVR